MASVILFPNVATHRKLPHLPKESKNQQQLQQQQQQDSKTPQPSFVHASQFLAIDNRNGSSASFSSPSDLDGPNSALALAASTPLPQGNSAISPKSAQHKISASSSASSISNYHDPGTSPDPKANLAINTNQAKRGKDQQFVAVNITSASTSTSSLVSSSSVKQDHVHHHHGHEVPVKAQPSPIKAQQQQLQHQHQHHNHPPTNPLNSPHGLNIPLSTLPPASTPTSTSSSLHESRMMKNALYDAFGCLYHPVQHTHHPAASSLPPLAVSTASCSQSRLSATLRSGEVTPLLGISPRASPMLRPQSDASAPITPLELSSDGFSAGGYFGHHIASTTGPSSRHLQHHHHHPIHHHHSHHHHGHGHGHHHPHSHHPSRHASSNLSASYSCELGSNPSSSTTSPQSLSRRQSFEFNKITNNNNNNTGHSSPLDLNPTEHPVLCSLQTLSLTHPHPPQHYHPHLGHDLGHDRVPIPQPSTGLPVPLPPSAVRSDSILNGGPSPVTDSALPIPMVAVKVSSPLHPLTPGEMLMESGSRSSTTLPVRSSPFPMDTQSQFEDHSSSSSGHQKLV